MAACETFLTPLITVNVVSINETYCYTGPVDCTGVSQDYLQISGEITLTNNVAGCLVNLEPSVSTGGTDWFEHGDIGFRARGSADPLVDDATCRFFEITDSAGVPIDTTAVLAIPDGTSIDLHIS